MSLESGFDMMIRMDHDQSMNERRSDLYQGRISMKYLKYILKIVEASTYLSDVLPTPYRLGLELAPSFAL